MRRALLLLLLGVFWVTRPAAAEKWTYAASEHFEVYSTGGARNAREALTYFERVHAFFTERFALEVKSKVPTRLIIFSNERQFAPYRPGEGAAAYYLGGPDRDYIVMERLDDESNPIVVHEYAHLMFKHAGANYPLWLNEGLAEFYSTMTMDGDRMVVGHVPVARLMYLNSGVRLIELDRLFAIDHDSPEYNTRQHSGVFYSQSWALAHMLMATDRYTPKVEAFLTMVAGGRSSTDAFREVYGKSPAAVMADLVNYTTQSQYLGYTPKFTPPKRASYATREVEPFEADLVTANLLANARDSERQAREAFERLESQKPGDIGLLESRAYFELRHGNRQEAVSYLSRAIDLGTTNPRVYRDRVALDPSDAETLLPKAVALLPDDVDLRMAHATHLLNQRKGAQAVLALQAVKQITPDKAFRLFMLTANGFLLLNQIDDARTSAQRAAKYAREGVEQETVARLVTSIDEFTAARAEAERRRAEVEASRASGSAELSFSAPAPLAGGGGAGGADSLPAAGPTVPLPAGRTLTLDPSVSLRARGRVRNIICSGKVLVLELLAAKELLRLVIVEPSSISVVGPPKGVVDLACGPQDFPLTVTYRPVVDEAYRTVGRIQVMDYRDAQ